MNAYRVTGCHRKESRVLPLRSGGSAGEAGERGRQLAKPPKGAYHGPDGPLTIDHQGNLFGIPPTGKKVRVTATVWYRVENGRLAEGWINRDDFGMMRQLGVIPSQ